MNLDNLRMTYETVALDANMFLKFFSQMLVRKKMQRMCKSFGQVIQS